MRRRNGEFGFLSRQFSLSKIDAIWPSPEFYEEIEQDFWLMDDHRWALWAWEQGRRRYPDRFPACLVHIDAHSDAGNFWLSREELERLRGLSEQEVRTILDGPGLKHLSSVCCDSFIAPGCARNLIKHVDFLCHESERGFDVEDLGLLGVTQSMLRDASELPRIEGGSRMLFDLDIDTFNDIETPCDTNYWDKDQMEALLDKCEPLVRNAVVVTVAISFNCSGEIDDARELTKHVVGRLLNFRR